MSVKDLSLYIRKHLINYLEKNPELLGSPEFINPVYYAELNKGYKKGDIIGDLTFRASIVDNPKIKEEILNRLSSEIEMLKGSKSVLDNIEDKLTDAFLDKKTISKKTTTKISGKFKLRDTKGRFASLIGIKDIINKNLHDQIQQNMGKGNATHILNYRTGRFAGKFNNDPNNRSAEIVALEKRKHSIIAFYTYMKYPYATFAPGGKQYMNKPSRDPNKLITKSIRQLARKLVDNRFRVVPKEI